MELGASARGRYFSPSTTKALTRHASDYAEKGYDNWLSRYYSKMSPYQSMAGLGQTTAAQMARTGAYTGANIGQNYLAGGMAQTNALMAGASGLGNIGVNLAQQYYGQPTTAIEPVNYRREIGGFGGR